MRIEGLSGNSGVMIKETFCTIRCTSKLAAWTERLKFSIYGSLYILFKKGFLCRDKAGERQVLDKEKN